MTRPDHWSSAYVVTLADQILWNYQTIWARLTDIDPAVSDQRMRALLSAVKIQNDMARRGDVEQLHLEIVRFRQAGEQAFSQPADIPDLIFCTCDFPLEYRGLPGDGKVPAGEVEILHMGDMPPTTYDWLHRREIAHFKNLQVLALFNCALGHQRLEIDLAALPVLRALDLRENGLTRLPEEALECRSLEYLDLSDNRLELLPDLSALKTLRCLRLVRSGLRPDSISALRGQLKDCQVIA